MNANRKAFLAMISHSEGTNYGPCDGYNILYGSTKANPSYFLSYVDHPRKKIRAAGITSTAAGRYQILARYYDAYKKTLNLPDFSPTSQDKIALQMINECHALPLIDAGNFVGAVHACASRWASFPGAGYEGQHEQKISDLEEAYINAGGVVTA